ncbi:VOC family protein [Caulobacter hibisci]|uniref:VOC family protein n=1 Tax=Caulobacter hibisci TaxID=2035993 RepID=A0ABS0SVH3_9CAUL|nr:VOC family protein [Caulobacter hibisci]MBI1683642.1 VOC family protein [Caulobacter hibisci]
MRLRSIELNLPDTAAAADFLTGTWGLADAGSAGETRYLRGSGTFPYLVAMTETPGPSVRCTTFVGEEAEVEAIAAKARAAGAPVVETVSEDLGGGRGILVQLPEGEVFRFLHDAALAEPIEGRELPVKLTHVVMNAADAEATADFAEAALGFKVSDRTKGMVFVRCNASHHSTAFARAGFTSLNHIAFEMADLDAVMRGVGRLRDTGAVPAWGPGRHGPGDNVFAYFIAPFGAVVEFSTAVEVIPDDYKVGAPEDWTWPEGRIDQWGLSGKDFAALTQAERTFGHAALPTA